MKATGIVRRIDDLGRVVIPKEIRRTMRIREGDPLEIFTDREGEVIFKKYSPLGEMGEYATAMCEAVHRSTGCAVAVADRDTVISVAGGQKKELLEMRISRELEGIMEERGVYQLKSGGRHITVTEGGNKTVCVAAPVISEGDVMGCVVLFADGEFVTGEAEYKVAQTAAGFLGRQMES